MKKLNYQIDDSLIGLEEKKKNDDDVEFLITVKTDEALRRLRDIRKFYDSDKVYTDILFYTLVNRQYQVIVRRDVYVPFILRLFQFRLIRFVEWQDVGKLKS
ncbi:hypothetical protein QS257_03930 [Terrilactibacillus sp. S3-3]|nr:hypothetical protein QS257_03930 [Terrilactibacillus sp. S3-3]